MDEGQRSKVRSPNSSESARTLGDAAAGATGGPRRPLAAALAVRGLHSDGWGSPICTSTSLSGTGTLARRDGFLGVVLPRTAFNTKGSQGFREWLYVGSATHRVDFLLNNNRWIFDYASPRYSIALGRGRAHDTISDSSDRSGWYGHYPRADWHQQASSDGVRLTTSALGPGRETPLLRSQDEADLLAKLRVGSRFPLGTRGRWMCFPVQGDLNETHDRRFWRDEHEGQPLWKGESFDQFDPNGAGERSCPITGKLLKKVRKARPGMKSLIAKAASLSIRKKAVLTELKRARVAFRDVTNRTNSRTILACLVPPGIFLTNKAPYLAFVNGQPLEQAACLAIMNSLPFDWQARRYIEINVNFFLLEGLCLPQLGDDDFNAIAEAAARLSAVDDRFADFAAAAGVEYGPLDSAERIPLRVEIDARVARGWNLTTADLSVIFRDFTEDAVTPAYRAAFVRRLKELT